MEQPIVRGAHYDTGVVKVTLDGVPDRPAAVAAVFRCCADAWIRPDPIRHGCPAPGLRQFTLVVPESDTLAVVTALGRARTAIGYTALSHDAGIGTVTLSGAALATHTRIIAQFFEALAQGGVPVHFVSVTDTRITAVTPRHRAAAAAQALALAFGLGRDGVNSSARQPRYRLTEA
ncbi:ACT domain-containing protein [Streptomyces sp. NPDC006314]|uniref:ACT domain-containing protein n=1 Tax=Streptomyces sp. NPDC006314 TaxID=3154475 RepID=UPI00339E1D39